MKLRLKYATFLALFGISYTFALRMIGSFFPNIFLNFVVVQITQIILLLAALTILFFFIAFHQDYVRKEQTMLKRAAVLAIVGSCAMILTHIKNLSLVFRLYLFRSLTTYHFIEVIPWISSIFVLVFFIIFYREKLPREQIQLKNAIFFAILGSSVQIIALTFILIIHLFAGKILFPTDISIVLWISYIAIPIFAFLTRFYFFLSFYQVQT